MPKNKTQSFHKRLHNLLIEMNVSHGQVIRSYIEKAGGMVTDDGVKDLDLLYNSVIEQAFHFPIGETNGEIRNPRDAREFKQRLQHYLEVAEPQMEAIADRPAVTALAHLADNLIRSLAAVRAR